MTAETKRKLDHIRWAAIVDGLLLVALIYGVVVDSDSISPIVGPIHGLGVILLIYLTAKGAGEERWPWWFAGISVIPFATLVGEVFVRRQVEATV